MNILLNNRNESFNLNEMTIDELLKEKKYSFKNLVIKINNQLIKREDYKTGKIKDGDTVLVLHMISGG